MYEGKREGETGKGSLTSVSMWGVDGGEKPCSWVIRNAPPDSSSLPRGPGAGTMLYVLSGFPFLASSQESFPE